MFRSDRWWRHELERINRAHEAREAELITTICRLAGKPAPRNVEPRKDDLQPVHWSATPEQFVER